MRETSILIGGFGGQGVLLLGRLIAYGGMLEDKEVTCFPSYGAEMRGGTANCTVIISEELIGSPIVFDIDLLIAMNEASLKRFSGRVKPGGVIIYNTSLIGKPDLRVDVKYIGVPANEIAASANMVMLGAFISYSGLIKPDSAYNALRMLTGSKGEERFLKNIEAIKRGIDYIASKKG
ncbi:MAG: 2-oxoacid:acceptor oxidoreductase family protein [Thermodesulfovibrionales bacterium]